MLAMTSKIGSFVLSPGDNFESANLGLPQTAVVVTLIGLTQGLPSYFFGSIEGWGILASILFWAVIGIATAIILWAVLSVFVYGFIRHQSGYDIPRIASYVGITAIPWTVFAVIQSLILLSFVFRGVPADASTLTARMGLITPILMSLTLLWQARLLLPAVRIGGGVNLERARGTVTIFSLVGLALIWGTFPT